MNTLTNTKVHLQ